ncbi:hypothetical protein PtA15_3A264 [Puccinia triticina]|uniref:Uncharacterized protein n=1 Tax=Puccinia triticina TaxID=208348 RepID=A0ABY7CDX6_9BASI|nr:uncharacterized protein PtA15_3A264 [Puccinia triticina]WAQ82899.1 hypothetical protein PtA15_3A264 [Puccinia triticina]
MIGCSPGTLHTYKKPSAGRYIPTVLLQHSSTARTNIFVRVPGHQCPYLPGFFFPKFAISSPHLDSSDSNVGGHISRPDCQLSTRRCTSPAPPFCYPARPPPGLLAAAPKPQPIIDKGTTFTCFDLKDSGFTNGWCATLLQNPGLKNYYFIRAANKVGAAEHFNYNCDNLKMEGNKCCKKDWVPRVSDRMEYYTHTSGKTWLPKAVPDDKQSSGHQQLTKPSPLTTQSCIRHTPFPAPQEPWIFWFWQRFTGCKRDASREPAGDLSVFQSVERRLPDGMRLESGHPKSSNACLDEDGDRARPPSCPTHDAGGGNATVAEGRGPRLALEKEHTTDCSPRAFPADVVLAVFLQGRDQLGAPGQRSTVRCVSPAPPRLRGPPLVAGPQLQPGIDKGTPFACFELEDSGRTAAAEPRAGPDRAHMSYAAKPQPLPPAAETACHGRTERDMAATPAGRRGRHGVCVSGPDVVGVCRARSPAARR